MPSTSRLVAVLATLAAGCLDEEAPQVDLEDLKATMRWSDSGKRAIDISVPLDIPCEGVEKTLLGEEGVTCTASWTLTVDGVGVETTPVTCQSAHDAFIAGYVEKSCSGGTAVSNLPDEIGEDIEIIAESDVDERRITLHGVGRTYTWTEVVPLTRDEEPGVIQVEGITLEGNMSAWFTPPAGGEATRGMARAVGDGRTDVELELGNVGPDGLYTVRLHGYARDEGMRIAVPVAGTLNVAR